MLPNIPMLLLLLPPACRPLAAPTPTPTLVPNPADDCPALAKTGRSPLPRCPDPCPAMPLLAEADPFAECADPARLGNILFKEASI